MAGERRCVVFGGSGNVGRAICGALARGETLAGGEARVRIGFTYFRGEDAAREILERLPGSAARRVDLASVADLERASAELAAELGGVDAFVHAAGLSTTQDPPGFDSIDSINPEGWDRLMAVNVRSAFFGVKALLPHLKVSRGNVVFMGSIDTLRPMPGPAHYASSKGALRAMALSLSKELGPSGVKVNMVAPGLLEGGLSRTMPEDLRAEYLKHCGLRRTGRLDEIASLVAYLALSNTYMTGQALAVDGAL